ncbi:hypothetical protein GPOL_c01740 [Gordonia polyisoprenivorans VH2]|uniref:Methyltransferase domain-containing protein n=1 Tax=Gordonia polyisoprenivorans (strain DSM 44266 / VH2) TaxID=1112204 RepID=H6MRA2_GORPV|nr:hypothetical protein GPOL_c01740 [Gordonia polyisoprenivorans VH2]
MQQYYQPRTSQDIDLVCPADTAYSLIEQLYPSDQFNVQDVNDDALRPSWEVTERGRNGTSTYIGPKIAERHPYQFVDYEWLLTRAEPYRLAGDKLRNILVPSLESVSFLKLLALAARLESRPEKGEQDLRDFINLTNLPEFRLNIFLDMFDDSSKEHLTTRIVQLSISREQPLFAKSSVTRLSDLLFPSYPDTLSSPVCTLYSPENSLEFYSRVANQYDQRNTQFLYDAHNAVIGQLRAHLDTGEYRGVIDIGCGTGRMIASHFAFRDLEWIAIDGCQEMLDQFEAYTSFDSAVIKPVVVNEDLQEFDFTNLPGSNGGQCWIGLVSFVLTSMSDDSVLERLLRDLPKLSTLIVADIHPLYTLKHPNYDFELPDGNADLRPRPVFPDILHETLRSYGFQLRHSQSVKKKQRDPYAFVYVFESTDSGELL